MPSLPPYTDMLEAFMSRDAAYDGVFYTAVRTTGIFCRPTCSARKPRPGNVEFFATVRDALFGGYRPCQRCRPMEPAGSTPEWLRGMLEEIDEAPTERWTDTDLRQRGLNPDRVRRWFQNAYGMTFHAYQRSRRLGLALGELRNGSEVAPAAFEHGYESLSGFHEAVKQLLGAPPGRARNKPVVYLERILTPLGPMLAGAANEGLCLLEFMDRRMLERQLKTVRSRFQCALAPGRNDVLDAAAREIDAYFRGGLRTFSAPLLSPGTDFQQAVWTELRRIPYGQTTSYGALAAKLGRPAAVRAVARANGDNRIAIILPCHRVVGSDGQLTGYAGGLHRKQWLLDHERSHLNGERQADLFDGRLTNADG